MVAEGGVEDEEALVGEEPSVGVFVGEAVEEKLLVGQYRLVDGLLEGRSLLLSQFLLLHILNVIDV